MENPPSLKMPIFANRSILIVQPLQLLFFNPLNSCNVIYKTFNLKLIQSARINNACKEADAVVAVQKCPSPSSG